MKHPTVTIARSGAMPFGEQWFKAWEIAFLGDAGWEGPATRLVLQHKDGSAAAVMGLATQCRGPVRVQSIAGYYWPQRAVGFSPDADVPAAAQELASNWHTSNATRVLRLGPIASDDMGTQSFIAALRKLGWRGLKRNGGTLLRLTVPNATEGLRSAVSNSMLKNLTYLRRRLDKQHGGVEAIRMSLRSEAAAPLIQRLAAIEKTSWVVDDGGDPKFVGARNQTFWTALASSHEPAWEPIVWILKIGDSDVAFSAHIESGATIWILANSYDAAWRGHSPGSLLTLDVLQHAIANGINLVDWGQGDSGYKSRWGAQEAASLQDHVLFRPGPLGAALYWTAKRVLKAWQCN